MSDTAKRGDEDDVTSDPARDDQVGSDWVGEGGATPQGPATDTPGPRDDGDPDSGAGEDVPPPAGDTAGGGQRGSTKHGPALDEQLEQETRGLVQGHGDPHAEPFRETEPLPDDTDAKDVERAFRGDDASEEDT